MDTAWMYNVNKMDAYFRGELDKFIKVIENHEERRRHCWYIARAESVGIWKYLATQLQSDRMW